MLHIILVILKIIGIILLVLLGLVLALGAAVLFSPVKYQVKGEAGGTLDSLKADVKVSWLFHLVSGKVLYDSGKLEWKFRAAWLKWNDETEADDGGRLTDSEKEELSDQEFDQEVERLLAEQFPEEETTKTEEEKEKISSEEKKTEEEEIKCLESKEKTAGPLRRLWEKIKGIWSKIKYTFRNLCARIKVLIQRKNMIMEFLADKTHKSALARVKREVKRLLKKMKPKRFKLKLHYGFEDPCWTGKTLAFLSVISPFVQGHMEVVPEFEDSIFEGELFIRGNIRASYFAQAALALLFDKSIRRTYKDFRKIKF